MKSEALSHIRICDFTGQLAGAGATRWMAAFGAEIIRIEDPVRLGKWDVLRGTSPFVDDRRGHEFGGCFNNHNVEKLGVTLNLRTDRGKELLAEIIAVSDAVTENFAAGVLERLGFGYDRLKEIKPDILYVSNCGFGHVGPYRKYKTWGPIVQACCGLTFTSGLPDMPSAGWGYSYMDHHGGNFMAMAIMAGLIHRSRTGEGQWIDMSCTDAGATMLGPVALDYTVNGRPLRRDGMPYSNRSQFPAMAPHGIYEADGHDAWLALAARDDRDWQAIAGLMGINDQRFDDLAGRLAYEDELDDAVRAWTSGRDRFKAAAELQAVGVPAAGVAKPEDRIDNDPNTEAWGLWPTVTHGEMGRIRVDGIPAHFSETDWVLERGGPLLGQHNRQILGGLLGHSDAELADLAAEGVI